MNSKGKGRFRLFIGTLFTQFVSYLSAHLDRDWLKECRRSKKTSPMCAKSRYWRQNPVGHFAATQSSLSSAVSLAFVYSSLTTSHTHSPSPPTLCVHYTLSALLFPSCVCALQFCTETLVCTRALAWLCESSEDRGEPRACLVGTHDRSHRGAPAQKQQRWGFCDTWYYAIVLYDSLVSGVWGAVGAQGGISEAENRNLELNTYFTRG